MNYNITPPLVQLNYRATKELSYTPILIDYVAPVLLLQSGDPRPNAVYRMLIEPPDSDLPAHQQIIRDKILITIPFQEPLAIKLVASDQFTPKGVYKVSIYKDGQSNPLQTQKWIVPTITDSNRTEVVRAEEGNLDLIPHNVDFPIYEVVEVSHSGTWRLQGGGILWVDNPPEAGKRYSVTYKPAVSLFYLIHH
jgi:hypothetical protein